MLDFFNFFWYEIVSLTIQFMILVFVGAIAMYIFLRKELTYEQEDEEKKRQKSVQTDGSEH